MKLPRVDSKLFKHFRYFWRLDIPKLGKQSSFPLCGAIKTASSFKHALTSDLAGLKVVHCRSES